MNDQEGRGPAAARRIPVAVGLALVTAGLQERDAVVFAAPAGTVQVAAAALAKAEADSGLTGWSAVLDSGVDDVCALVNHWSLIEVARRSRAGLLLSLMVVLARQDAGALCAAAGIGPPGRWDRYILLADQLEQAVTYPSMLLAALGLADPAALAAIRTAAAPEVSPPG